MQTTTESLNGTHPLKPSGIVSDTLQKAETLMEQAKDQGHRVEERVKSSLSFTDDYAQRHPWRMAITFAGLGFFIGAVLFRRK